MQLGSEDALSATGSDHTPLHVAAQHHDQSTLSTTSVPTAEERICSLEKEMVHWRTQYEILKINEAVMLNDTKNGLYENNITCSSAIVPEYSNCSCSSTAAGLMVKSSSTEVKRYLKLVIQPFNVEYKKKTYFLLCVLMKIIYK